MSSRCFGHSNRFLNDVVATIAVQTHPHEPDTEREQFIVAHRLAHDAGALGDGLRGHGKAYAEKHKKRHEAKLLHAAGKTV